jgi:hypothetical protein
VQEFWLTKSPKHNRDESTIQNSKNLSRNGIIFTGRGNRRGCLIAIERYNVIRNSHHFCLENKSAWAVWISELHLISISKQVCNVDLLIRNLTWLSCSPLFRSRCVLNHPPSREMTCCKSNVTYRIVSRNFVISFRIVFWIKRACPVKSSVTSGNVQKPSDCLPRLLFFWPFAFTVWSFSSLPIQRGTRISRITYLSPPVPRQLNAFLYSSDRIIEEFGSISMPIDKLLANAAYIYWKVWFSCLFTLNVDLRHFLWPVLLVD